MRLNRSKEALLGKESSGGFPWLRAAFFLLVLFAVIVPFTDVPLKLKNYVKEIILAKKEADRMAYIPEQEVSDAIIHVEEQKEEQAAVETETPTVATPDPDPIMVEKAITSKEHFVGTRGDMVRMSKGFHFDYSFETQKGDLASKERQDKSSYVAEYKLKINLPKPSSSLDELAKVSPYLPKILPGLASLLDTSKVSDFYYTLYENKVKRIEREVLKLNELSTKHNFYDCETILNLTNAENGRKVLLMQGDMDVVSDGSDGDRLAEMPSKIVNSTHYQPFTSYGWKKTGTTPNPMIAGWEKRIGNAEREISDAKTTADRRAWLKARKKKLQRGIEDMKARSYLIADYDPFVVMPVNMITNRSDKHAARIGDYAVVIVGNKVYPAIVGDGGPTFKVGEGSLRLTKEINERASSYSRPVSDVTVTYLVFSNSRELPASAPDYQKWHDRCAQLLEEIGGLGEGYKLHQWKDLFVKEVVTEGETTDSESEVVPETRADAGN